MLRKYNTNESAWGCLFTVIVFGIAFFISEYGWIGLGIVFFTLIIAFLIKALPGTDEEKWLKEKYYMLKKSLWIKERVLSWVFDNKIIFSISFFCASALFTYRIGQELYFEDDFNLKDTWIIWILFIVIQAFIQSKIWKHKSL